MTLVTMDHDHHYLNSIIGENGWQFHFVSHMVTNIKLNMSEYG